MPRALSWLPRLHEIRRSVENSSRSHYTRKELEYLFQLQPRAAQKLLEILPTTAVGTSRLAEREALAHFLDQIHAAENPSAAMEAIRQQKQSVSRCHAALKSRNGAGLLSIRFRELTANSLY